MLQCGDSKHLEEILPEVDIDSSVLDTVREALGRRNDTGALIRISRVIISYRNGGIELASMEPQGL